VLDTDREKAREALDFTLSLVSTGLTEMRALIFELRPEALEAEGLVAALSRKSAELRAATTSIALELHMSRVFHKQRRRAVSHRQKPCKNGQLAPATGWRCAWIASRRLLP
jgi:signal transduction histidine kinase